MVIHTDLDLTPGSRTAFGTNPKIVENMFGATTNYPFNFANRNGIPMIESGNVTTTETNVVIGIPNRAFRFLNGTGLILFRLNTPIPENAASLPILFSSNGFTQPLTVVGGIAATGEQMASVGVYVAYYDKGNNILQLMTFVPAAPAATANTTNP